MIDMRDMERFWERERERESEYFFCPAICLCIGKFRKAQKVYIQKMQLSNLADS